MKQILLAVVGSLFLANMIFSQSIAFQENFNAGIPATFTLYNKDGLTPNAQVSEYTNAWISKEDPADATNKVASSTSYFSPVGSANRWLVTPAITLGGYGNSLSWKGKSHDASYSDSYYVLLSKTANVIDSFKDTVAAVFYEDIEWVSHTVDLSELGHDGEVVYIAFVLRTYDGFKLYIDDILVEKEDPASVLEKSILNLSVFPNPATDYLVVYSDVSGLNKVIKDVNGKVILSTNEDKIDVQSLESGIYFIELQYLNTIEVRKIIKI
ncbi:MAG: T9SS type A sorting domain-containing protein [Crocinitomicaceae bacterium]|nr:T9SS type A sorting domain-containing protein [Crocinitomicaceae bacterium]